jgi:hypothetical protein
MRIRTTDKLFYRSFPYKAVIQNEWGYAANYFNVKDIPKIKKGDLTDWGAANRAAREYPNEVIGLIQLLGKYDKTQLRRRTEGRGLSLFFKDRAILDNLKKISKKNSVVAEFWEPVSEEALMFMKTNRRVEVKKHLTHGCRYKVALQGSISKLSPDGKKNFVNLVKRNLDEFHISEDMLDSFKREYRHFWGNYFYVRDSKFLLMAQMILQPIIKEVVKIVTHDEIQQEEITNV